MMNNFVFLTHDLPADGDCGQCVSSVPGLYMGGAEASQGGHDIMCVSPGFKDRKFYNLNSELVIHIMDDLNDVIHVFSFH